MAQLRIILLVGLPGCGKSTWARRQGVKPLSSDAMRLLLTDNENDQSIHPQVFAALRYLLIERLKLGRPATYIDATHLAPWERQPYFEIAAHHNATVEAVLFDVPLAECKRRNRRRARKVPDTVLDEMQAKLVPPTRAEGFSHVTVITFPSPAA